mmetsp:Transcript_16738/g.31041  ORF Transcript_16738/g.31041 Transcript_16738/m.31041 type:complete len:114 (-) Transcript_16738:231-572(-)
MANHGQRAIHGYDRTLLQKTILRDHFLSSCMLWVVSRRHGCPQQHLLYFLARQFALPTAIFKNLLTYHMPQMVQNGRRVQSTTDPYLSTSNRRCNSSDFDILVLQIPRTEGSF